MEEAKETEPQTPMWMPVLGVGLFLAYGIWWGTRPVPVAPPQPVVAVASASVSAAPLPSAMPRGSATPPMPVPHRR
jgi:hypothetical protein